MFNRYARISPLTIEVAVESASVVIRCWGTIDASNADRVEWAAATCARILARQSSRRREWTEAAGGELTAIEIDLREIDELDRCGVEALLRAGEDLAREGRSVGVRVPPFTVLPFDAATADEAWD